MPQVWFTSDLHFGHNKSFLYESRGFNSIEEHDEAIINNWNSVVAATDTVFVLGDIMLNDNENGIKKFERLNGYKNIILGNHDTATRITLYQELNNVLTCTYATPLKYGKYHFYLSHYPTITSNYDLDKPLKQKVISLCGHSHTKDKFTDFDKGLIYHCELDAHNCYPVSIDKIIEDIKSR